MERGKRVRQILRSDSFRKELEQLVTNENRPDGSTSADLTKLHSLEQLSNLILPTAQLTAKQHTPRGSCCCFDVSSVP